jgi:hypothetical protein
MFCTSGKECTQASKSNCMGMCWNGFCSDRCNSKYDCAGNRWCVQNRCSRIHGEHCTSAEDCASGICLGAICVSDVGGECANSSECNANLSCGVDGFCGRNAGQNCTTGDECVSKQCFHGLCVSAAAGPCSNDYQCVPGLLCVGGICVIKAGNTCDPSRPGSQCTPGTSCYGYCLADLDGPCSISSECISDLICSNSKCVPAPTSECGPGRSCPFGKWCDIDQRCVLGAGQGPCMVDRQCETGTTCVEYRCVFPYRAPCANDLECAERCVYNACTEPIR